MEVLDSIDKLESYTLTGKYVSKLKIVGLQISDIKGNKKILKTSDIHYMVSQGLVTGCSLVQYNDNVYIKSNKVKLAELPEVSLAGQSSFSISSRVMKNDSLIGYIAIDKTGKEYKLSKERVWDMARQGGFENITSYVVGKNKIIEGIGMNLQDLHVIKV